VGSGPNKYEGTVDLSSTDSQAAGLPASYTFTAADAGSYTFTNVVLKTAGSRAITATDSVTSTITGSTTVDVTAPPTIVFEQVVTTQKTKKGKPVFAGFEFVYSTAMNPSTAGVKTYYHVFSESTTRVKKKLVPSYKPVGGLRTTYNKATNTVTLNLKSSQPFAKGGRITISGVTSAAGVPLDPNYDLFTIQAKASKVTRGS